MTNKLVQKRRAGGFTLIEVVVTVALVSFMGISILGALAFGAHQKQSIRERNGALRAAADVMETVKRTHFSQLRRETFQGVMLDDGTLRGNRGRVRGDVSLRFFTTDDVEVGLPNSPVPLDLSMLRVEVEVTWSPSGRNSNKQQTERIVTLLAP